MLLSMACSVLAKGLWLVNRRIQLVNDLNDLLETCTLDLMVALKTLSEVNIRESQAH